MARVPRIKAVSAFLLNFRMSGPSRGHRPAARTVPSTPATRQGDYEQTFQISTTLEFILQNQVCHETFGTRNARPGRPHTSEGRRVGKACVSMCRYRWPPVHRNKNHRNTTLKNIK